MTGMYDCAQEDKKERTNTEGRKEGREKKMKNCEKSERNKRRSV